MITNNIKDLKEKMQLEFAEYIKAIEEFEKNPCGITKRKALEKGKTRSSTKNRLNLKIKDVWCKEVL